MAITSLNGFVTSKEAIGDWPIIAIQHETLPQNEKERLWLPVVFFYQLEEIGRKTGVSINQAAARFGEISVPDYMLEPGQNEIKFIPDLGLWQEKDFGKLFG